MGPPRDGRAMDAWRQDGDGAMPPADRRVPKVTIEGVEDENSSREAVPRFLSPSIRFLPVLAMASEAWKRPVDQLQNVQVCRDE